MIKPEQVKEIFSNYEYPFGTRIAVADALNKTIDKLEFLKSDESTDFLLGANEALQTAIDILKSNFLKEEEKEE